MGVHRPVGVHRRLPAIDLHWSALHLMSLLQGIIYVHILRGVMPVLWWLSRTVMTRVVAILGLLLRHNLLMM